VSGVGCRVLGVERGRRTRHSTLITRHPFLFAALGVLASAPSLAIWPPEAAAILAAQMPPRLEASLPGPLLFPPTNWWSTEVAAAPVDPGSAAYLGYVNQGGVKHLHPDFGGSAGGNDIYGFPYCVVDGAQAKLTVQFDQADESDGVTHPDDVSFPFYPVPNEAIAMPHWVEGGDPGNVDERADQDRHLLMVDRDNRHLYELYNVYYDGAGWQAYSGAFFDMNTNDRRPEGWTSADAAGLAILPGLVRWDEVYGAGEIRHAFRLTVRHTKGYVYPASHLAGTQVDGALPMGARLRLKASKDISGFDPWVQKIFRAMKTYGLIVADNGTDMYISGTWDDRWDNDVLNPDFDGLTASDFEVVQLGWNPPVAPALSVDEHPGAGSDANGVLEPGETAVVAPSWQSPAGGGALAGSIAAVWGPPGAAYTAAKAVDPSVYVLTAGLSPTGVNDGRAADDGEGEALFDVRLRHVERADEGGAHRAGPRPLGPEHPEIGEERIVPAEQVDQAELVPLLVEEAIVFRDRSWRQRPTLLRDALDLAAELDLLGKKGGARPAIIGALAGPADRQRLRHIARGPQRVARRQSRGVAHLPLPCPALFDPDLRIGI